MEVLVTREKLKVAFAPIVPLIEEAVEEARIASSRQVIAAANPEVKRLAHLQRLAGTKRWMVLADGLVRRKESYPDGFILESTDADHNQGKYAFRFPMGICTVKREPHSEDDGQGKYIQEAIEGVLEQAQLAPNIDAFAAVKAYISVPPEGVVRFIATHPTLSEPVVILIDEIARADMGSVVAGPPSTSTVAGPARVSSALTTDADSEDAASEDEQD
ncbi:MAG TPA: hypothetical protein VGI73_17100 [Solirubrobacterales bacterium]|jgi:hypothetical protein